MLFRVMCPTGGCVLCMNISFSLVSKLLAILRSFSLTVNASPFAAGVHVTDLLCTVITYSLGGSTQLYTYTDRTPHVSRSLPRELTLVGRWEGRAGIMEIFLSD